MGYMADLAKNAAKNAGEMAQKSSAACGAFAGFAALARNKAKIILAAGALAALAGGYAGIQHWRAGSAAQDAQAVAASYDGASAVAGREREIAGGRLAKAQEKVKLAQPNAEALAVFEAVDASGFGQELDKRYAQALAQIEALPKIEASAKNTLAAVQKGAGDGEILDASAPFRELLSGQDLSKLGKQPFGEAGFYSKGVEQYGLWVDKEGQLARDAAKAAKADALDKAPRAGSGVLDSAAANLHAKIQKGIMAAFQKDYDSQVEQMREQVRQEARRAFEREGESMSYSDWDEIRRDIESDWDWRRALSGLKDALWSQAHDASLAASQACEKEKQAAQDLAARALTDPEALDKMEPSRLALLAYWLNGASNPAYAKADGQSLYAKGASLAGGPLIGMTPDSARAAAGQGQWTQDVQWGAGYAAKRVAVRYVAENLSQKALEKYRFETAAREAADRMAQDRAQQSARQRAQDLAQQRAAQAAERKAAMEAVQKARDMAQQKAAAEAKRKAQQEHEAKLEKQAQEAKKAQQQAADEARQAEQKPMKRKSSF